MNEENEWSGELDNVPTNLGMVEQVSIDEVRKAVQSMKNGRATGPDSIPAEVWKFLKEDGWSWLTLFFNKLLHEEEIPEEWCNSLLYEDLGKSDRKETEVTQNQFGFMPGRGTTDAIFALRQLCEKYRGARRNLHMVFIDLEKAYDRVPRDVLWWAMKVKRVPGKYIIADMWLTKISTNVAATIVTNKCSQPNELEPFFIWSSDLSIDLSQSGCGPRGWASLTGHFLSGSTLPGS
nr:uncharacterized protein LOC117996811 [Maniola hyperantus]